MMSFDDESSFLLGSPYRSRRSATVLCGAGSALLERRADLVITHSPVEAELLRRETNPAKVHVVPFAARSGRLCRSFADHHGIAFIGSLDHAPDHDALHYLLHDILPLVWQRDPALTCAIVGYGWRADQLPKRDHRVKVVGAVDDLGNVFDRLRLTVAPLRFGAGIKGKVLDSFAAGLPCVLTPIAAEGLTLPASLQQLIADTPAAIADRILGCHADQGVNEVAAEAALAVAQHRVVKTLEAALASASSDLPAVGHRIVA